jgi:type IX secretion system PorP/SprF family membrane protein
MKTFFLYFSLLVIGIIAQAQQSAIYYHPWLNPYLYNPASAGIDESTRCFLQYQKTMQNMTGSPETFTFTAEHPFSNPKMGIGITFSSDHENFISNKTGYLTYRYRLQLGNNHRLSGALSAGFIHNSLRFENIEAEFPEESGLYELEGSQTAPDANLSLLYQFKKLGIGFSSFNLINSHLKYYNQNNQNATTYSMVRQFNIVANYKYPISPSFELEPYLLLQSIQGMPIVFNPALNFKYRSKAWVGCSWRPKTGASICAGGEIHEKYAITYAYSLPLTHTSSIIGPTHEITFRIRFQAQKQTTNETATTNQDFSREEFDHLVAITQKQFDEIDKLNKKNEELKELVSENENNLKEQQNEIQRMHQILQKERDNVAAMAEIQKKQEKAQLKANQPTTLPSTVTLQKKDTADRIFENTRYHVIIGAYLSLVDAEMFQDVLKKERGIITRIVPSDETDNFLIYSRGVKDDEDAERGQLHKLSYQKYKLGNIWFYNQKNKGLDLGASNTQNP